MASSILKEYVSHEVQRFADYLRAEKRTEATVDNYTRGLRMFYCFAGKSLEELTKGDMQAGKADLAGRYSQNGMIPRIVSVNTYLVKVANREDLKMEAPRWVEKDVVPLTESEVVAFLKEARSSSPKNYMISCLIFYGGLRASEVANLRLSGLDLDRKMLRVHEGKEKNYSMILLNDATVQAIRDYLMHTRDSIKPRTGCEDFLLLTESGKPMDRHRVYSFVKWIAANAGITKNVYPHLFRHTMATKMATMGCTVFEIQAQTRHKSIQMVQKYVHISADTRRAAYERVFGTESPERPGPAPVPVPMPASGPSIYAQDAQQPVVMTMQQLQQLIHAAVSSKDSRPLPGYQ